MPKKLTPDERALDRVPEYYTHAATAERVGGARFLWFSGSLTVVRASLNADLRNPVIWERVEGKWRQVK